MAKGRNGFYLEGWKFAVYLAIPLGASWYFNDPARQRESADYWAYCKYPANPNTNMKEQIEELRQKQQQRTVYRDQMMELQKQAQRSREAVNDDDDQDTGRGWLRWIGLGKSQQP
jgi:hypothetical protein